LACYVGTRPADGYLKLLLWRICRDAGIPVDLEAPLGVEVVRRKKDGSSFLFALNHSHETVDLQLPGPGRDLLSGRRHEASVALEPLGVMVLEESG
jgi:beta-galactosidase